MPHIVQVQIETHVFVQQINSNVVNIGIFIVLKLAYKLLCLGSKSESGIKIQKQPDPIFPQMKEDVDVKIFHNPSNTIRAIGVDLLPLIIASEYCIRENRFRIQP